MSVEKEPQLVFGYFISRDEFDKLEDAGYVDQDALSSLCDEGHPGLPAITCQETDYGIAIGVVLCEGLEEGEAEFVDAGYLKKTMSDKNLENKLKDLVDTVLYGGTLSDLPCLFLWTWIGY